MTEPTQPPASPQPTDATQRHLNWQPLIIGVATGVILSIASTFFLFQGRISQMEGRIPQMEGRISQLEGRLVHIEPSQTTSSAQASQPPSFDLTVNKSAPRFSGKLVAANLSQSRPYVLSVNGKVGQDGNTELMKYGAFGGEGYYDFAEKYSDSKGAFLQEFEVTLPPGKYDVTVLLKDKASPNYTPVFSRDHVHFTVLP